MGWRGYPLKYFWFIFFCSLSYGADLPKGSQIEVMSDFSGGLNTVAPAHKIPKQFSPNMRNVFTHRAPGKLIKRNGLVVAGSTRTLIDGRSGFTFYHADGSKEFIVSDSSLVLSTKDFSTYVFISSGLNSTGIVEFAQLGYKVYMTNGIDPVFTWDGTVKQVLDGTNGTPNVPKGKVIATYQNRIFVGNTSSDRTSLDWSAVVSTGGAILTPDNFLAWPVLNHKSIGLGDGEAVTALWVQKVLQIGKERSIWSLFGNSDSSFIEKRMEDQAGVSSQECVVLMDGVAYHKGFDGIYFYNTDHSERISDAIQPDVAQMQDPTTRILQNSWESQSDFLKGQFANSTATVDGLVTVINGERLLNTSIKPNPSSANLSRLTNGSPSAGFSVFTPTITVEPQGVFNIKSWRIYIQPSCPDQSVLPKVRWTIKNLTTNEISTVSYQMLGLTDISTVLKFVNGEGSDTFFGTTITFSGSQINSSQLSIKAELINTMSCVYADVTLNDPVASDMTLVAKTTGQFISDVSTLTSVTAWGQFNSVRETNQGSINYFLRTSTSVVNIATKTWTSIVPGITINEPLTNNFIQWATTVSAVSTTTIPDIDNVTIDHIEGSGAANRPVAIGWNNEYWLSVSTELTSSLRLQYVKSWVTNPNPHSWDVMAQMNVGSLFKDGASTLYGGSTSTGVFYRLDYGTNDNGQAIDAFYETPEYALKGGLFGGLDGTWVEKQITEYWVEADQETGNTLRLGSSYNGAAFTEDLVSLSGNGTQIVYKRNPTPFAKSFRWRLRNNDLDKGLGVSSLAVIYQPLNTR